MSIGRILIYFIMSPDMEYDNLERKFFFCVLACYIFK